MPIIFGLMACGADSQTSKKEKAQNNEGEQLDQNEEVNIEVINETFAAWTSSKNSTGAVWVNYSSEIKNLGNEPAKIENVKIDFLDSEENILQTVPLIASIPDIIMPNQTSYIIESVPLEAMKDPAELADVRSNIETSVSDKKPIMLETDNVELVELDQGYAEINMPYTVTGTITNPHSEKADNILISAGLYNDKDELVGVLKRDFDKDLNPGASEEFELNYPELPADISGKATKVRVKAYKSTT